MTVASGQTLLVRESTRPRCLTIEGNGAIAAPPGYTLTLTVNGIETGSAFTETASAVTGEGGETTALQPGTYCGQVVLTVAEANNVPWQQFTFPLRQALYVDGTGVVESKP